MQFPQGKHKGDKRQRQVVQGTQEEGVLREPDGD